VPRKKQKSGVEAKKKKKMVTLTKKDYIEMLKSMFKLMVGGLSNDRLKII
jgi:hypothetical protein